MPIICKFVITMERIIDNTAVIFIPNFSYEWNIVANSTLPNDTKGNAKASKFITNYKS